MRNAVLMFNFYKPLNCEISRHCTAVKLNFATPLNNVRNVPGSWNWNRRQMFAASSASSSLVWMNRPRFMTRLKQANTSIVTSTNMISSRAPRRSRVWWN